MTDEERCTMMRNNYASQMKMLGYDSSGNPIDGKEYIDDAAGKMGFKGGKYATKIVTDFGFIPKREDLIQRGALMDAYDAEHKGPPGRARELIALAPAVDAIPVEWLEKLAERKAGNSNMWIMQEFLSRSVEAILQLWKDEHNAT